MSAPSTVRSVLIVDDDDRVRQVIAEYVTAEGNEAWEATNGLEALWVVKHQRPGLVLLDLTMPRLGGHEFRRAQLGDPSVAGVPIAVMSGAIDAEAHGQALGAVATLMKPIDLDLLLGIVRRYCA
jgi:CheY-like chemotaxis protein